MINDIHMSLNIILVLIRTESGAPKRLVFEISLSFSLQGEPILNFDLIKNQETSLYQSCFADIKLHFFIIIHEFIHIVVLCRPWVTFLVK